jgi:hypothetical protein
MIITKICTLNLAHSQDSIIGVTNIGSEDIFLAGENTPLSIAVDGSCRRCLQMALRNQITTPINRYRDTSTKSDTDNLTGDMSYPGHDYLFEEERESYIGFNNEDDEYIEEFG